MANDSGKDSLISINSDKLPKGDIKIKIVERYNGLLKHDDNLSRNVIYRHENAYLIKDLIKDSLLSIENDINDLNSHLSRVIKKKRLLGAQFSQLLKSDSFHTLTDKVDELQYEEYVSVEEFERMLTKRGY